MSSLSPEQLTEIRARAEAVPLEPPFSHGAFAIADRRKLLAHIDACFAPEPRGKEPPHCPSCNCGEHILGPPETKREP